MIDARDDIIDIFEKRIFPYKDNAFKTKGESEEESEENKFKNSKFFKYIEDESMGLFWFLLWQKNYMK